jgi:hypothetical protein
MKIDCVADLHGFYPETPGGDVLIVGGDLTKSNRQWQYLEFRNWLRAQDYKHRILVCRKAFGKHLILVAKALHDIEWVDSCDYGEGDEVKAIMKVVNPKDVLNSSIHDAKSIIKTLQEIIALNEK